MNTENIKNELKQRFLQYVSIDTQSSYNSQTYPSTDKQFVLIGLLAEQLSLIGVQNVSVDKFGYVTGTIPASKGYEKCRVIGLLAHVDTSPDVSGQNVKTRIWEKYNGGDLVLNHKEIIREIEYPEMKKLVGHDLITSDGNTLLGADDKAGIAEIMTAANIILKNPQIKHGEIKIAFTPDEEIGRGVDFFDPRKFGADIAYTLDGGAEGELEYENFNAAYAKIEIYGKNHHPGAAKGRMINALEVAYEAHAMLPHEQKPQFTDGYEGFFHLTDMSGNVENASIEYIIRDHSDEEFERRKIVIWSIVDFLSKRYGDKVLKLTIKDQYLNMRKMVEPHMQMITIAEEAMRIAGVTPDIKPIRGGTDGARLSFMGLPCPNLFTGGGNFHSRHEYCSLTTMEKAVRVIVNLVELWGKQ